MPSEHPEWIYGDYFYMSGTSQAAAVVSDTFSARMAMLHNDARILCIGERIVGAGLAAELVDAWMGASFEGGRHGRRVGKMEPNG